MSRTTRYTTNGLILNPKASLALGFHNHHPVATAVLLKRLNLLSTVPKLWLKVQ
tara:strand:- start:4133 stop:4294 length:162 start_codon:yes stop_codon:yes gene_type:complete